MRTRLTLARVFVAMMAGLAVVLGGLIYVLETGSRAAIADSAAWLRDSASEQVRARVAAYLGQAESAADGLGARLLGQSCPVADAGAIESCLFATAAANPNLSEVTFTHAVRTGFAGDGRPLLDPEGRWQVSVYRDRAGDDARLCTRRTWRDAGRFVATVRCREPAQVLLAAPPDRPVDQAVFDPTEHLTFVTPASRASAVRTIPTDLSYAELDAELPPAARRVVVTMMKPIEDRGAFAGVVRVGLLASHIDDEVAAIRVNHDPDDPFRIFLCDGGGRLVTRLGPGDRLALSGDDLRIAPEHASAMVELALRDPALHRAAAADGPADGPATGRFEQGGRAYDVSFRRLAGTQGWLVGIVGPEDYYLSALRGTLRRLLALALGVIALAIAGGALTVRALRRGLAQITRQAARLQAFDFAPAPPRASFTDVAEVLDSVEQAKTAMRAMRKYVPVDLVRELYESNREPVLGGRLADLSLLFTDVRGFTTLAETLEPDRLARLLGYYFSAMTTAVHGAHGTVDKYIGDAVMAMWNAPRPCPNHPVAACRAALSCVAGTRALFASDAWEGLPPLVTRFGIHRGRVMVGHFGAPDRFSFTAIGDGVNLAARLEGLNKLYGTTILVSDAIERDARDHFAFRRVDRVAVKGKSIGILVYELLGERDVDPARAAAAEAYERALDAYFARDFDGALAMLGALGDDGPARVLAERCSALRTAPPPPDWDGTFAATEK